MIGRRAFTAGLASMIAAAAHADVVVNGQTMAEPEAPKKKRRDIPFTPLEQVPNHRQMMRDVIIGLSAYAKQRNPHFVCLVRNAPELLVKETREWKWETLRDPEHTESFAKPGTLNRPFLRAIDGMLADGLSYGTPDYGKPTSDATVRALVGAGAVLRREGRRFLAIDYCADKGMVANAETWAARAGALAYVDRDGDKLLDRIPAERPTRENPNAVTDILHARNFLPLLRSDSFGTRADWIAAMAATNHDLLIVDPFWRETESISFEQMRKLRYKRLGTDRLVFAVLPLAKARDTRFYWKQEWKPGAPEFLVGADPDDPAQTIAKYWDPKWKEIIGRYMAGLVDLGIDGVLFDQADTYLYFEDLMPLE